MIRHREIKGDARPEIIGYLAAAFLIASLRSLHGSAGALVFSVVAALMMRRNPVSLLRGLKLPFMLLIPLFLLLPLTSGGGIMASPWGVRIYREGVVLAVMIFCKTGAILYLGAALLSCYSFSRLLTALRELHLPEKFIDLLQITWRYIFIYRDDLQKMSRALTLRGYRRRSSLKNLGVSASLIGSLLVRSYEQTESLYHAMIMRGYGAAATGAEKTVPDRGEILRGLFLVLVPVLIKICEIKVSLL